MICVHFVCERRVKTNVHIRRQSSQHNWRHNQEHRHNMQQIPTTRSKQRSPMASGLPLLILCLFLVAIVGIRPSCAAAATDRQHRQQQQRQEGAADAAGCAHDRMVAYRVVLHTYWTRELFPKHYPDWRPAAQWTKTVGRSHDANFNVFSLGQPASAALKAFAESGRSDGLEQSSGAASSSVLDDFGLPAIQSGAGRAEGRLFVDANHTLVSLVTRIVPSPDWIVGVDSLQLCSGGSWIDSLTVELDPLDVGTDNGFTFTAPNWPTDPPGVVYRMTSHYPAHPAGSFYYPQNKRLPPIATFQFIKHKEFELSEVFGFAEDSRRYDTVQTTVHLDGEHNNFELNNELSADIELERQHEMARTKPAVRLTEKDRIRAKLLARLNQSTNYTTFSIDDINAGSQSLSNSNSNVPTAENLLYSAPRNNRTALLAGIARRYGASTGASLSKETIPSPASASFSSSSSTTHRRRKQRPHGSKDCRVGHWSDWSGCSRTCGIGEMQRRRKVIRHARRGGRPCPPLLESKWCGSASDCSRSEADGQQHFQW